MTWVQSAILWAAVPFAILLMVATIDALATVLKTEQPSEEDDTGIVSQPRT